MHDLSAFANRLRKSLKPRRSWAKQANVEAFRLYDADIPELPFIVDLYGPHAVVYDRRDGEASAAAEDELRAVVSSALSMPAELVHIKGRRRMPGAAQYTKLSDGGRPLVVAEESSRYLVNLTDYLDTGLFLDHRPLRSRFRKLPSGLRLLNLFCYTGSVSVAAAQAGVITDSVDLSATYLEWAQDNFRTNGLDLAKHGFIRADAREFLEQRPAEHPLYDIVFLDPPTFSNSKRMVGVLDIQRDHRRLIDLAMAWTAPGGILYFSTNKKVFMLDENLSRKYEVADITASTIPEDFRDPRIHRAFTLKHRP